MHLDQVDYLHTVLQRCGMSNCKVAATPLLAGYVPTKSEGQTDPELRSRFQTVIGSLLYLMLGTRPDIAFTVTKLARRPNPQAFVTFIASPEGSALLNAHGLESIS